MNATKIATLVVAAIATSSIVAAPASKDIVDTAVDSKPMTASRSDCKAANFKLELTPGSTAGCRRFEGHFIPPGPLHPEVRHQAAVRRGP